MKHIVKLLLNDSNPKLAKLMHIVIFLLYVVAIPLAKTTRISLKVLGAGLEPACLAAYAPQTYVSASFTTRAK
jgi:hypothetical protein